MAPIFKVAVLVNFALLAASQGTQFITGPCTSDADCASACCGFKSGKCAGPIIAQERDGGCGFGDAQPNDTAALALTGGQPPVVSSSPAAAAAEPVASAAASSAPVAAAAATSAAGPGNGAGKQFITGACSSDADCASACCGFKSGKCAGPVVAQERDGGCGFGNAQPNANAAEALTGGTGAASVAAATAAQPTTPAKAPGTQFITGACTSDADCASACCGFKSGKCAGPVVAQERDGGCGFGNAQPNANAAEALTGGTGAASADAAQSAPAAAAQPTTPAKAPGTQFITGACTSDADCASACCGFKSGKCAGPVVAQERDGGCGFGNAQPNDTAAKALQQRR